MTDFNEEELELMLDSIKGEPTGKALNIDTTVLQRVATVRESIQRHLNTYGKDRQQYITIKVDELRKTKGWGFFFEMCDLVALNNFTQCIVISTSKKRWKVLFDDGSYKYFPRKNKATILWEPVRRFE